MYSSRSVALHRAAVMAIVLAALVVAFVQARALWTLAEGIPFGRSVLVGDFTVPGGEFFDYYSTFGFSAFSGLLALFLSWKLPQRPDARVAALLMAFFASFLSLLVVPSGLPTFVHRAIYSISAACSFVLFLRFTMVFPRTLSLADLAPLSGGAQPSWRQRLGQMIRGAQGFTLSHPSLLWWLGAFYVGLTYVVTSYVALGHYLGEMILSRPLAWVLLLLWVPFHFAVQGLALSFLWTGYRLANSEERGKILWIVLGAIAAVALFGFGMALVYAEYLTHIRALTAVVNALGYVGLSVLWFCGLAGFAVAILSFGAFDVRPLINKTTVDGTIGVLFILLFAVVESLTSELVEARLGLPDMAGAVVSGVIVAAIVLPLRRAFSRRVSRWAPMTDGGG